jgi:hypothetical protein
MSDDMPCCPDKSAPVDCDQCPLMALCVSTTLQAPLTAGVAEIQPSRFECCFPAAIPKWKASRTHPLQNLPDPWSVRRNAEFARGALWRPRPCCVRSRPEDRGYHYEGQSVFAQPAACADRRCLTCGAHRRVRRREELRVQTGRTDRQGRSDKTIAVRLVDKTTASLFRMRSFSPRASTWLPMAMQEMATRLDPAPGIGTRHLPVQGHVRHGRPVAIVARRQGAG